MSAKTPHRTATTPTSRATFTPCTRMNNLTLNSHSGTNRTKAMNCQQQAFDFGKRIFEIAGEEDDTPEHPNLTMVLGPQKIRFDQLMDDDQVKPSMMILSDDDDSDEEANETSNTYSPCRMSLSPDRGFPQQSMDTYDDSVKESIIGSPSLFSKKLTKHDPHYDPKFSFTHGTIYEDGQDDETTCPGVLDLSSVNGIENDAPSLWLKHFDPSVINLKKTPIGNNTHYHKSSPLQEISVNHNLPLVYDEAEDRSLRHTQKKKVVGDRPYRMRMMRSLSPTREDMRKGKEPSISNIHNNNPSTSTSNNISKHIDASIAFFL